MLIWVHWAVNMPWSYAIVICLSFMCDGSMTSMLPPLSLEIFSIKRGPQVYGWMYSCFASAAMLGALFVKVGQDNIGYHGMLMVCLGSTCVAAITTFFYDFTPVNYL